MKRFTRGFTLIELLVVIAIIGILASVVLVSLQSARKKGNDARIISNVRSMKSVLEYNINDSSKYPDLTPVGRIARYSTVATNGTMSSQLRMLIADTLVQQTQVGVPGTIRYAATDALAPALQTGSVLITKNNASPGDGYSIYAKLSNGSVFCMESSGKVDPGSLIPDVVTDLDSDLKGTTCKK